MDTRKQIAIMKTVTGEAPRMYKATAEKRKNIWVAWYHKEYTQEFEASQHLLTIARQFHDEWDVVIPEDDDISKQIDPKILQSVANEIRHILQACNRVSRRATRSHEDRSTVTCYSHTPNVESPLTKRMRSTVSTPTKRMKSAVPLPSSMPITPSITTTHITVITPTITVDTFPSSLKRMELKTTNKQHLMPPSISITELTELLPAQLSRAINNVKSVRTSLLNAMVDVIGELFLPDMNDLLLQWKSDGAQYANGERLPAVNYQKHAANGHLSLTDEAVHCIRHIVFCFKIPIMSWYSLTDNSEYHGRKRHVLLITAIKGHKDAFLNPCFWFVMASEAVSGDSEGNSKLNVKKLIGYLPLTTLAHYGGNITDNANNAIDESRKTFNGTIKHIEESTDNEEERILLTTRFGVP
eukprot:scaffold4659_cov73-Attheya_sp.AAC.3